jgi:hypothetical protein
VCASTGSLVLAPYLSNGILLEILWQTDSRDLRRVISVHSREFKVFHTGAFKSYYFVFLLLSSHRRYYCTGVRGNVESQNLDDAHFFEGKKNKIWMMLHREILVPESAQATPAIYTFYSVVGPWSQNARLGNCLVYLHKQHQQCVHEQYHFLVTQVTLCFVLGSWS